MCFLEIIPLRKNTGLLVAVLYSIPLLLAFNQQFKVGFNFFLKSGNCKSGLLQAVSHSNAGECS